MEKPNVGAVAIKPNDQDLSDELIDHLNASLSKAHSYFLDQLKANGYHNELFSLDSDIVIITGKHPTEAYTELENIRNDITVIQHKALPDIIIVFLVGVQDLGEFWALYTSMDGKGLCIIPTERNIFIPALVCHELGHAFGLDHNNEDEKSLMHPVITVGGGENGLIKDLSAEECLKLSRSIYFNTEGEPKMPINVNEKIQEHVQKSDELIDTLNEAAANSKHLQQEIKNVIDTYKQHVIRDMHKIVADALGINSLYEDEDLGDIEDLDDVDNPDDIDDVEEIEDHPEGTNGP